MQLQGALVPDDGVRDEQVGDGGTQGSPAVRGARVGPHECDYDASVVHHGLQRARGRDGAGGGGCVDVQKALADFPDFYAVDAPEEDQEDDREPIFETVLVAEGSVVSEEQRGAGMGTSWDG